MNNTVFLDLETTGFHADDEILEVGISDHNGNALIDSYVKPVEKTSWKEAQAINNISPKMVASAPTLEELKPQIIEAIKDKTVVIYNASFDTKFLSGIIEHAANVECCMLAFAEHNNVLDEKRGGFKWIKQVVAAEFIGYEWTGRAHSALADSLACRGVWLYLQGVTPDADLPYEAFALREIHKGKYAEEYLLAGRSKDEAKQKLWTDKLGGFYKKWFDALLKQAETKSLKHSVLDSFLEQSGNGDKAGHLLSTFRGVYEAGLPADYVVPERYRSA